MESKAHVLQALHVPAVAALLCILSGVWPLLAGLPQNKGTYPEKGKVVAVHVEQTIEYAPIMPTDSKGRTHGGEAFVHRKQIYLVKAGDEAYEIEGGRKKGLTVGDTVEFRVHKNSAKVRADGLARKYRIISRSSISR